MAHRVHILTLGLSLTLTLSEGGATPVYTQFGAGARPAGLGGAFSAVADDANSAIWNTANMVLAPGPELSGTHVSSYMGSSFDCIAGVLPISVAGFSSSLGIYLIRVTTGDIPIAPAELDSNIEYPSGDLGAFETVSAALGIGTRLSRLFLVGIGAKIIRTRLLQAVAQGKAFDISISLDARTGHSLLRRTTLSAQIKNLAAGLIWSSGYRELESPLAVLGLAYRPWPEGKLILATEFETSPWGMNPKSAWRFGLEFLLSGAVPLRFGYQSESVAAGIGCRTKHIRLDYALSFHKQLAESHCVSLTLAR